MSKPHQDIVYEGWLTKSPPSKRVWRAKWSRRWFTLRQSGELPGQYFLDYFADRNSQKLKGTIDLDLCDQVDAGLQMQRRSSEGSAFRGSVFSIRTHSRVYHLEADCVSEMEKWVYVICRACGMRSTDDDKYYTRGNEQATTDQASPNNSGPYIAISECITGLPKQIIQERDNSLIFVFNSRYNKGKSEGDPGNRSTDNGQLVVSSHLNSALGSTQTAGRSISKSSERSAQCNENDVVLDVNDTNIPTPKTFYCLGDSDAAQRGISKTFSRLSVTDHLAPGTPMPPRPPKPSHLSLDLTQKDTFIGPRIHEPSDAPSNFICTKESNSYWNLNYPPAVNRGLKPGRPRTSTTMSLDHQESYLRSHRHDTKKLQYLDLDLDLESSSSHVKSRLAVDSPTVYKTVDFLKTEALNMTRMDTEAYRRNDIPLHD